MHIVVLDVNGMNHFRQRRGAFEDTPDEPLSTFIARVGFAGVDQLDGAYIAGNALQPFPVVKQEVGPLVSAGAAREADRKSLRVERDRGPVADFRE